MFVGAERYDRIQSFKPEKYSVLSVAAKISGVGQSRSEEHPPTPVPTLVSFEKLLGVFH